MVDRIFIDTFSAFDELPKKYWGDDNTVLEMLKKVGRVSTFEMNQTLMNTLNRLVAKGKITDLKSGYPWHSYKINEIEGEKP